MRRIGGIATLILAVGLSQAFPRATGATVPLFGETCNGLPATIKQHFGTVRGTGGSGTDTAVECLTTVNVP